MASYKEIIIGIPTTGFRGLRGLKRTSKRQLFDTFILKGFVPLGLRRGFQGFKRVVVVRDLGHARAPNPNVRDPVPGMFPGPLFDCHPFILSIFKALKSKLLNPLNP